jgi:hypothetical protein
MTESRNWHWRRAVFLIGLSAASLWLAAACSSGVAPTSAMAASPVPASSSPSPIPVHLAPSPSPIPAKPSLTKAVVFHGLRAGTYPVHLHLRCNGSQGFHIIVLQSVRVAASGRGSIDVRSTYFGRSLCLIVYSDPSLSAVLTTHMI